MGANPHAQPASHEHGAAHDVDHHHADGAPDKGDTGHDHASKCCGLFVLNGMVPDVDFVTVIAPMLSHVAAALSGNLSGQDGDRIDRPPRSLLSL